MAPAFPRASEALPPNAFAVGQQVLVDWGDGEEHAARVLELHIELRGEVMRGSLSATPCTTRHPPAFRAVVATLCETCLASKQYRMHSTSRLEL